MGTKVQCKSYLPGYNPMRGHDDDRNSSWSMFCDGKTLNGHFYNDFRMKPMNGYLEYDKEMLKRTMLEHEAVFRKQVYELHRLYRIQNKLMDELKRKELFKYPAEMTSSQTLQAHSFSSRILLEDTKTLLHTTHLPVENACYSRASAAGLEDMKHPLNFLKDNQGSVQSGQSSVENGGSVKDDELLESKCNSFPRRVLDLHLPADAYIDNDDKDRPEKEHVVESSFQDGDFLKRSHCNRPENNVVLTLGTGGYSARREHSESSHSHTKNGISVQNMTDLSNPMKGSSSMAAARLTAACVFGPRTYHADTQESKLLLNAHTSSLNLRKDFLGDKDKGAPSKYAYSEMELSRHESSMFRKNSGQSSGNVSFSPCLYDGKPKMSSKEMELKLYGMHGVLISDKTKIQSWFNQRPPEDVEDYGRNSHLAVLNRSVMVGAPTAEACSMVPSGHSITASPLDSSWRKPTNRVSHIPIAVQAIPCFNTAASLNLRHVGSNMQHEDQRPYLKAESDPFAYPSGIHHNSSMDRNPAPPSSCPSIFSGKTNQHISSDSSAFGTPEGHATEKLFKGLHCIDVKSAKDLNLNQAFSSGIRDSLTSDRDILILDMERKHEGPLGSNSWFGHKSSVEKTVERNAAGMELVSTQSYSQLLSRFSAVASECDRKPEKDKALFISSLQEFPLTLEVKESRMQRNEVSDSPSNRKMLEFPILEKVHQNGTCSPSVTRASQSLNNDTKCNKRKTPHYTNNKMPTLENQLHCGNANGSGSCSFNFRNHINLNCSLACVENPEFTAVLSSAKVALEIDLEAPVLCQANDDINSLPESLAAKHQSTPEQTVSSKVACSNDTENLHEKCMREAAECIIALSMETSGNSEALTRHKMSPAGCDVLHWFVEVVSDNAEEESKIGHRCSESLDGDSLDLFEMMTLQLKETKMDECWCQPQEPVHQNNEGKNATSLLLTRCRRGQARKRRQRRDFQKDILPGLASLARHEVREDLQAIGGLMKASGRSSQTSLSRRNTNQNGTQGQARRTRRPRGQPVSPEIHVGPLAPMPVTMDIKDDGGAMMGWGRTTRRCRRPRCPPGNVNAPLV